MHAMKRTDQGFTEFGEAYFSVVKQGCVKGWKRHARMQLNVIVPCGAIRFVLYDDRQTSPSRGQIDEYTLSRAGNYQRITVPPAVWMAFEGLGPGASMLLNLASIPHDPLEAETVPLGSDAIPFNGFARNSQF